MVSCRYRHVFNIDPDECGVWSWRTVGPSRVDAPARGHHEAVKVLMAGAVVGRLGPGAERLGGVVVAPDPPPLVGIEDLVAAVGVDAGRKPHVQLPPGVAALLPGAGRVQLIRGVGEDEGDAEVGPHRITSEVQQVESVPPKQVPEIAEGATWLAAAGQDAAAGGLDPDFGAFEPPLPPGGRVGFKRHVLPAAPDDDRCPDRHLEQFHPEAGSPECGADPHCIELVPECGAPVSLDHLLGQGEARVAGRGAVASHLGCLLSDELPASSSTDSCATSAICRTAAGWVCPVLLLIGASG